MEPLQSFLPRTVRALLRNGPLSQDKLEFAWRAAVGPVIDRVTTVRLADGGEVEVTVADATWRRELRRSQADLLGRLRALLGPETVTTVRVTEGPAARNT